MASTLYVFAVRDYPGGPRAFADSVDKQLEVVRRWWPTSPSSEPAFDEFEAAPLANRRDVETAIHAAGLRHLDKDHVTVLYVTGHGTRSGSGRHYLVLPDTPHGEHLAHGYPTADLITTVLASHAQDVLVIVNSCFAGELDAELAALRKDLPSERRLRSLAVLVTADFDEMPRADEFTSVLAEAYEWVTTRAGYVDQFLSIDQFVQELADARSRLVANGADVLEFRNIWREGPSPEPSRCVPNPGYQPEPATITSVQRRQVATTTAELDYWLERASGRTSTDDPGWYFTGRRALTSQTADFLRNGTGMLVVTGAAGTGKSAILARAVTLSDPAFRSDSRYSAALAAAPTTTVPPPNSVDIALLARSKTTEELLTQLLIAAGEIPDSRIDNMNRTGDLRQQLLTALPTGRITTIVIDGLDEASRPISVITDIIGPLLRHRTVRLVVGVRSSLPSRPEHTAERGVLDLLLRFRTIDPVTVIRTDGPDTATDIAGYLSAFVGTEETALVDRIADAVAPSFLDARFAGERLRSLSLLPAHDPDLLAALREGTVGLLRDDLSDVATDAHPMPMLLAVLRATAFALGGGVPWADIWPAMASAILDSTVPDTAVAHVLDSRLSGYLIHDTADGRVVYRPAHEALADVLRDEPYRLLGDSHDR